MEFLMLKNNFGDWKNARKAFLLFSHIPHLISSYYPSQLYILKKAKVFTVKAKVTVKTKKVYQNLRGNFVQENLH